MESLIISMSVKSLKINKLEDIEPKPYGLFLLMTIKAHIHTVEFRDRRR